MRIYPCGAIPSPPDARDYRIASAATVPEKHQNDMPPVVDQGAIGNCVAQACCYATYATAKIPFDPNWLYGRRGDDEYQGAGWYIRSALKTLLREGNVPASNSKQTPLEVADVQAYVKRNADKLLRAAKPHRIEAYARLTTAQEIKAALVAGMRVVFSAPIESFEVDSTGLFRCRTNVYGYHAMSVWGYDGDRFLVQNSWGEEWGDGGRCWMLAEDMLRADDCWAVTDTTNVIQPEGGRMKKYIGGVSEGNALVVRETPDVDSAKVGTLRNGDEVTILDTSDGRALVGTGTCGWIAQKYLVDEPPEPAPEPEPDIGDEPDDAPSKLQWYLHKWGFGALVGAIDGKIGTKTKEALKQFQSAMGLTADGVAGKHTWVALKSDVIVPRITEADMNCTCGGKYCDGKPNPSTAGVRLLIERIWMALERRHAGARIFISNTAHTPPDGAIAGGQRCKKWNEVRGGAASSQHLYGRGADIFGQVEGQTDAQTRQEIEDIAMLLNVFGGVGYGAKYIVHVDVRGRYARWKY